MNTGNRKIISTVTFSIIGLVTVLAWTAFAMADKAAVLDDFEECVAAGNPIMESYPRRCQSANKIFTEDIGNAIEMADEIRVVIPRPNQGVTLPLVIKGEARGGWFYKGAFSIELLGASGQQIAIAEAQALEDWMTDRFVPFTADVVLEGSAIPERAVFIFRKNSPTGTEVDVKLTLPVRILEGSEAQEPADTSRAFSRRVALAPGDAIQFSDGLFVRLADIRFTHCPSDVHCSWKEEMAAELEMSGGKLGMSITDVHLSLEQAQGVTVRDYAFELVEATNDQIVLKVPANLAALVLRYDSLASSR